METGSTSPDFKRRNILLVNPRFQLKYSLYVVTWLIPMIVVFPLITYELFEYIIRISSHLNLPPEAVKDLTSTRRSVILLLVLAEISFILATFLISLRVSHKIAGPVYKLRKRIREAAQGDWGPALNFRNADHFSELADDFNELRAKYSSATPAKSKKAIQAD